MANIESFKFRWKWKLWLATIFLSLIFVVLIALFWRQITPSERPVVLTMIGALFVGVLGVGAFMVSFLKTTLILPLIGLTRDTQTQKLIGQKIDADNYKETMLAPLISAFVSENNPEAGPSHNSEGRLAEVLHLIEQSIIVTDPEHRIVLVNARAREMFQGQTGLGLGRDLRNVLNIDPIKAASIRIALDPDGRSERVLINMKNNRLLPARVSLLRDQSGAVLAHIIGFNDLTNTLFQMNALERQHEALVGSARDFASYINFAALNHNDQMMYEKSVEFSSELLELHERSQEMIGNAWPKARVNLRVFSTLLSERLNFAHVTDPGQNVVLRADIASLLVMIEMLTNGLHHAGYLQILVSFEVAEDEIKVIITTSTKVKIELIETLMKTALTEIPTAPTADEILRFHGTEIWPHMEDAQSALVFILPRILSELPVSVGRPDYYEFQLPDIAANLADTPLRDLPVVVFDSETTGLDPKGGDKVVQISAVRVLGGKVLGAEVFDELVNPERNIPMASTKIHKITNEMVKGAHVFSDVLHDFHGYCHDDVLLAHNAAFDMAFLGAGAKTAGLVFGQPVLDTVYMSAFLFDHTGKHTLDDLSKRLGVTIPEEARHTALGDAIATAEVFVRLIPLLEERGVTTLGQMLEIGAQMHKIRKAQAVYG